MGLPYEEGSEGPGSYDCQGLANVVLRKMRLPELGQTGISDTSNIPGIHKCLLDIEENYDRIEPEERRPGDVVAIYYPSMSWIGHIGILLTENIFIHARHKIGVTKDRLNSMAWKKRIHGFYRTK